MLWGSRLGSFQRWSFRYSHFDTVADRGDEPTGLAGSPNWVAVVARFGIGATILNNISSKSSSLIACESLPESSQSDVMART